MSRCRCLMLVLAIAAGCGRSESGSEPVRKGPRVAAAAVVQDAAPGRAPLPRHWIDATPRAAITRLLGLVQPVVLGVGEVHLVAGGPAVRSALARFADEMIDVLSGRATDLVVETWVNDGRCGAAEAKATATVKADMQRPPEVEDDITRLLRRGKELAMRPHVLTMRCDAYRAIQTDAGEVDYDKLLTHIGRELHAGVTAALAREGARVVVYGGSLHNDREPNEGVAAYSYGVALAAELGRGYVELDLYVPELVAGDELLRGEPWYPLLEQATTNQVVLIERAEDSYILLLQRGVPAPAPAAPVPAPAGAAR